MSALRIPCQAALLGMALMAVAPAFAAGSPTAPRAQPAADSHLIDFEDLAVGAIVSSQYAAWGVSFVANNYTGFNSPNGHWADNTDMTVVSSSGNDVGELGGPSLVSGKILHSLSGFFLEDGDANFGLAFDRTVTSISIDFAGIDPHSTAGIDIYTTGGSFVTTVAATQVGQQTLTYTGTDIGFVAVRPGDYNDWVGVDNISFTMATAVPEPETHGLMALGLGALAIAVRRRKR